MSPAFISASRFGIGVGALPGGHEMVVVLEDEHGGERAQRGERKQQQPRTDAEPPAQHGRAGRLARPGAMSVTTLASVARWRPESDASRACVTARTNFDRISTARYPPDGQWGLT